MGGYGYSAGLVVDFHMQGCRMGNDIHDHSQWGIVATNFMKDILLEDCVLSRMDVHQDVSGSYINLTQPERDKAIRSFKKGRARLLIATDVMARGIDVEDLAFVIHHQPPDQLVYYPHRSGRTASAGKKCVSITLIEPRERAKHERIGRELGVDFREAK